MKCNGTQSYARLHTRGLTLPQQSAVDLLAAGKTDTETAAQLSLSRVTVTRWRLYDPAFIAALNERRAEVWGAGIEQLRSLIPKALDVLAAALDNPDNPNRSGIALAVLKLAGLPEVKPDGPTDPEEALRAIARRKYSELPDDSDQLLQSLTGRPAFEAFVEQTARELDAKLTEPEPQP